MADSHGVGDLSVRLIRKVEGDRVERIVVHTSLARSEELCGRVDWQRQDDESLRLHHVCSKLRLQIQKSTTCMIMVMPIAHVRHLQLQCL